MSKVSILNSIAFKGYFSSEAKDKVYLPSEEDACKIWTEKIDKKPIFFSTPR